MRLAARDCVTEPAARALTALATAPVHGEVAEVDCLTFPDSGRFRGIAMVRFADEAGAWFVRVQGGMDVVC